MNSKVCPYLGQRDDPATALHFPSQGNFCHHARPVSGIKADHQEKYCLTENHFTCPVYRAATPAPLPSFAAQVNSDPASPRKTLSSIGLPILIAGVVAGGFAITALASRISPGGLIPNTGGASASAYGWSLFTLTQPPSSALTPNPENLAVANCPLPDGWAPYIASPTDSLYRLSIVYGVTEEKLRRVNCLDSDAVILPGQVIYVPLLSTSTPVNTPTQLPVQPVLVFESNNASSKKEEAPRPTPVPPKAKPPTKIVPTDPPEEKPEPEKIKPTKKTKEPKDKVDEKKDKKDKDDDKKDPDDDKDKDDDKDDRDDDKKDKDDRDDDKDKNDDRDDDD